MFTKVLVGLVLVMLSGGSTLHSQFFVLESPQEPGRPAVPQTTSPRDARSSRPGTGVLAGRVVAADTGAPLRRARVTLSAPELPQPRSVATDAIGRFGFQELPPGRYRLRAAKGAFVTRELGQRRPFEAGRAVDLADGEKLEKLEIALPRGCVITGQIVDDLGEPVTGMGVSALRRRYSEGKRQLVGVAATAHTNDVGQYRLYGLPPGTYYVGTTTGAGFDVLPYARAYHPGTPDPSQALPVSLRRSEERLNVDVVVQPSRVAKITGTAYDHTGRPLVAANVALLDVMAGSMRSVVPTAADGIFTVSGVAAGEYVFSVSARNAETGEAESGMFLLTVTGEDISGLVAVTTPGCRVSGRVVFEGGTAPAFTPSTIALTAAPPAQARGPVSLGRAVLRGDWSFEIRNVAGPTTLSVGRLPPGWMLKSVTLNGDDITDTPVEFTGTNDRSGLEITLTSRTTSVGGTVRDEKDRAVSEYTVVVFPEDASRWIERSRFIATARPDQQAGFRVENLPPARYLAIALDYLEDGQAFDPELLESLRGRATAFTLGEGETKRLTLTLVILEQ